MTSESLYILSGGTGNYCDCGCAEIDPVTAAHYPVDHNATRDHIEVNEAKPCWHCDVPTYFIELSFEAPLHPGVCTDAKWHEYFLAEREAGPVWLF